ncbi:hypothetical protein H4R33_006185 [Dimargaris cristalligena]|uniref:Uncharacterized protein n=1 Tax=Dimargaris cristalligena TaxID=215637 RepID=A0A4P9ZS07_9FUNG|nr:hypothetical protein H4R33_006185 [Dimargaris cristalligena]RKP35452.1 hypothetical protein BJ085DRAFT_35311 [Dimargaris cristalligena]|eukprot:RKP35452.1 hypothetical protein BJ085DRAFT_35311 [Dimargaris cristalligena]
MGLHIPRPAFWQNTLIRRIILGFVLAALVGILLGTSAGLFSQDITREGAPWEFPVRDTDHIATEISVLSMDLPNRRGNVHLAFEPQGRFRDEAGDLTAPLTAIIEGQIYNFTTSIPMRGLDLTVPLAGGNPRSFPYDRYYWTIRMAFRMAVSSNNDSTAGTPVPMNITLDGTVANVKFDVDVLTSTQGGHIRYALTVDIRRTSLTLFFTGFLLTVMWLLSLTMVILVYQTVFNNREIPPQLLTFGTVLLFAFPALRNSLPGVPQVGCLADMLGFFWPLLLVALCTCAILYHWLLSWTQPPPKVEPPPAPSTSTSTPRSSRAPMLGGQGEKSDAMSVPVTVHDDSKLTQMHDPYPSFPSRTRPFSTASSTSLPSVRRDSQRFMRTQDGYIIPEIESDVYPHHRQH